MAPIKITFLKNAALNVLITHIQVFLSENIGKNKFESKQAGLQFEFNDNLDGFEMLILLENIFTKINKKKRDMMKRLAN
jgi:hypothetical protein